MSTHTSLAGVKEATVEAVVIRADGTREDLGVISRMEQDRKPERRKRRKVDIVRTLTTLIGHHNLLILVGIYIALAMVSVLTNAGRDILTNRIKGSGTEPNYIGWGTGSGGGAGSTGLVAAAAEARTAGTSTRVTTSVTNDTYQVVGTITVAGAGKTISEVGLFDAAAAGNLFIYADFTGIALNVGDSIAFTIKLQFT